jgi:protein TonB
MQGWQGRVVIRVVIREDGNLADANVIESSGHDLLDSDAIGLLKKVCPIELQRALGQSHVVIHVPVSYSLTLEQ